MLIVSLIAAFLTVAGSVADQKRIGAQKPKTAAPMIQENLRNGSYIRLTDGSLWNIHPEDTPITQGWITPVEIQVSPSNDREYPYTLTNSLTGSSVKARRADSVPKK